jgi:hypothetical protein
LGGFDAAMDDDGADVDLCWRAQVAGARVMVVPAAVARHREGGAEAVRDDPRSVPALARNHLRTMLKSYSFLHLVRVLPQAAVVTVAEVLIALFQGRWSEARGLVTAWPSSIRSLSEIRRARRTIKRARAVPDSEVRRLHVRGSVRMSAYLRRRINPEDRARALVSAGQQLVGRVGKGPAQAATGLLALLCLALLVGSRHLLGGRIPAVGQFAPLPGATTLLSEFVHGWRTTGMGSAGSSPPAFGLLGFGGLVLLGHVALLQKLLLLATWPVAAVGAWRLGRAFRSGLGRMVMVVAYLAVPLSYDSLARGHWDGLVAYAAAPFVLRRLARIAGLDPFGHGGDDPDRRLLEVLGLALGLAAVASFVPSIALLVLLTALGLVLGSLVAGQVAGAARALVAGGVAVLAAVVLLLPWSFDQLRGGWESLVGPAPSPGRAFGLGALLRLEVGPIGAGVLGWALLVAAVLPLVLGQGWRLAWAVRCWGVVVVSVAVAWAGGRGWFPIHPQSPDVLLAPAAVALAMAAALGAAAFESDLPRYRFGWRQIASVVAGAAVTLGTVPILGASRDGAWRLPSPELARSLGYMQQRVAQGSFRVLWLGDPEVLPLGGWGMGGGLAYATSRDGMPAATDLLPGPPSAATRTIVSALGQAERGDTSRLGRLLAPLAVRYLVLPRQIAAGDPAGPQRPPPADLSRGLQSQLDLRLLPSDPAAVVYENTAWGPARQEVAPRAGEVFPATLGKGADLSGGAPVLPGRGPVSFGGDLRGGGRVIVSEAPSSRWVLTVGGREATRRTVFGVANAYAPGGAGHATLHYRTPLPRYALLVIEIILWAAALRLLLRLRRRVAAVTPPPRPVTASRPAETVPA